MPAFSYTRLAQMTGELLYNREYAGAYPSIPSSYAEIYTGFSHTGDACIYLNQTNANAFGVSFLKGMHTRSGFYLRFPNTLLTSGTGNLFYWSSRNYYLISPGHRLYADWATAELVLVIDNSELARVSFADWGIIPGTWIRFGYDFKPGEWLNIYINGRAAFAVTSMTDVDINGFWIGKYGTSVNSTMFYADDVYVDEVVFCPYPICPPDRIFLTSKVEGEGSFAEWTPYGGAQNWQNVDDAAIPDEETTHNYADATNKKDTFEMTDIIVPEIAGPDYWKINAVIPMVVAKRYNVAQACSLKPICYDGIRVGSEEEALYLGPDYLVAWARHTREPDGSRWTQTDVNEMEVGYLSGGTF